MIKNSVDEKTIANVNKDCKEFFYPTRFNFLREIYGIRPSMLTGVIGTTGSGKSTLIKSIVADSIKNDKCLVWLSEESIEEYQGKINLAVENKSHLKNLFFLEEKSLGDWVFNSHDTFMEEFENIVESSECKVIFIDNITSSYLYSEDISIREQGRSATIMQRICKKLNVSIFFVAHTKKNINDTYSGLIKAEDVRGSAKISIVSEYLYILQRFNSGEKVFPIVSIAKARHHQVDNTYFLLGFEDGIHKFDKIIPFSLVRKIYNSRDVL